MKIFFLLTIIIIVVLLISRIFIHSAKRNLFKDQASWSGKDIKIKYRNSREASESKGNANFLKIIANESKDYLETQLMKKEDETK